MTDESGSIRFAGIWGFDMRGYFTHLATAIAASLAVLGLSSTTPGQCQVNELAKLNGMQRRAIGSAGASPFKTI